jgi:orotate phosphoribosyltransferase
VPPYKTAFVDFMLSVGVLRFGDFLTKSGRATPYFVNTGLYSTGEQMSRLSGFYADAIEERDLEFDCLFGPAYKGIPLCVAIAMELARRGRDVPFCFNRKEAKDHGEGGNLVGHELRNGERILIVEDVTTAGTSIRETVPLLRGKAEVVVAGLVVSVDRMERGTGELTALAELRTEYQMQTAAIVNIEEIVEIIDSGAPKNGVILDAEWRKRYAAYREVWAGSDA